MHVLSLHVCKLCFHMDGRDDSLTRVACFVSQISCIFSEENSEHAERRVGKVVENSGWKSNFFSQSGANLVTDHEISGKSLQGNRWSPPSLPRRKLWFCYINFLHLVTGKSSRQRGWLSFRIQKQSRIMGDWKLFWTGFKKCWRGKTKHRKPQLKDLHMCWLPLQSCHHGISPILGERLHLHVCTKACTRTHTLQAYEICKWREVKASKTYNEKIWNRK